MDFRKETRSLFKDLTVMFAILFIVFSFWFQPFKIPSESMVPTL